MIEMFRERWYILDDANQVVSVPSLMDWAIWASEHDDKRNVDVTEINSDCYVSTCFLGLDHRHFGEGPPLVFETLIFGGPFDRWGKRYPTWDEAKAGHELAVIRARTGAAVS